MLQAVMMRRSLLRWLLLSTVLGEATKIESHGRSFTNMEVYDGKIYIGSANSILVLNATDLKTVKSVSTCTEECYNINKVLLINKKLEQLITCGTGHGGICEIRNLSSIDHVLSQSRNDSNYATNYLVVSTDEKRPACFVVSADNNVMFTGVTYGSGIIRRESGSYDYYLAKVHLIANKFMHRPSGHLNLNLRVTDVEDYLVYFKTSFRHQGFIYFLTNQKFKVAASSYVTKIIRVCANDTYFYSYTDILLKCTKDGTDYNLVQDISVLEPGVDLGTLLNTRAEIIMATFAVGSDPEQPDGQSAVCIYSIEDIDKKIMEAKKRFITCPLEHLQLEETYLPDNREERCLNTEYFEEEYVICDNALETFTFITGDKTSALSAVPVYNSSTFGQNGYFNKIQTFVTGSHTVMHVGTSRGYFFKMNVNSEKADVYQQIVIDDGNPITGVHVENGGKIEYVMSRNKIVRYETEDCSMYTTCEETMKAKNPLCGWCVYESKSTFNDNASCPYQSYSGHWLSSLSRCLSLVVEPRGIPIQQTARVKPRLTDVLPESLPGDHYVCDIRGTSQTERRESRRWPFECRTPYTAVHSEGEVQAFVIHNNRQILLAETDFLFYECGHYKRCSECLEDDRANCVWDSINTVCIESDQADYTLIFQTDRCPQFQDSGDIHYLPSGVSKELSFNVTNLVNSSDTEYACHLNSKQIEATKASGNQITCKLQEFAGNVDVLEYEIEILYGTSMLDKKNTVIVFNCAKLGTDCSVCRSMKNAISAYECDWCSGSCTYAVNKCLDVCKPSSVTRIVPNTAALNGQITVTVYGTELGSAVEEVQSISLAGVPCERNQEIFIPSKRVTCTAKASSDALSGEVIVVTNNQSSSGTVVFFYKMPIIEGLIPTIGPMAGGTRLTITGTDLGVGRRNVTVDVINSDQEHKECTNAQVMPDVELDKQVSLPFHIECDSPPGRVGTQLEAIEVLFDGSTLVSSNNSFTYLENPDIEGITPKKGIASGGNSLTVIGRNLKNADKGHIEANNVTTACILNSQTEVICAAPALSLELKEELYNREGSPSEATVMTEIAIHLDGFSITYSISYYVDPVFHQFNDDQKIKVLGVNQQALHIMGENLNLVAGEGDVIVTIGVATCEVIQFSERNITCLPPPGQPAPTLPDASFPEVNVSIGNVHSTVGYLKYTVIADVSKDTTTVIIAATVSSVLIIIVIVAFFLVMYKKNIKKMRKYEQQDIPLKQTIQEEGSTEFRQAGVKATESPTLVGVDENMQLILQEHHLLIDRQCLQLGDLLGRGHFGSVYKGNLLENVGGRSILVAVKTLHQKCPREIDVQAFLDEALIMKDFKHPRVLSLIGICLGMDAMPLVIFPYIPHGDLLSFVRDNKNNLSIRDVLSYGTDISEGMTYLSNLKFVHRDLAARNCMLDEMLHVKVADFGLSRDIYEKDYYSSDNKKTMLPVKWLALECLEKGKYTSKSDVWSFGIVMWELFTRGAHPYPEVDNWDIIRYLKNGRRLPQPQFCPDQIFKMMRNCWLPDPTDRPTFSVIEQTITDIVSVLEQDMKQGMGKANIENTYVNIDNCTEYIFTDTKTPLYDGDGYLSATTAPAVLSDAGLKQAPSSSYQSLDSTLTGMSGYDTLETKT